MKHSLVALVHDRPGVLNRAVSLFRRRGLNIESMTVARTDREGVSQMTWVVEADDVTPVLAQLEKLIDVLDVHATRTTGPAAHSPSPRTTSTTSSGYAMTQADGLA